MLGALVLLFLRCQFLNPPERLMSQDLLSGRNPNGLNLYIPRRCLGGYYLLSEALGGYPEGDPRIGLIQELFAVLLPSAIISSCQVVR